jgi:hypothetical protein
MEATMKLTRLDSTELKTAVDKAMQHINEAFKILAPYLVILTEEERRSMARAREGFQQAGNDLAYAMGQYPKVAAVTGYEAEAVQEDLRNVAAISPIFGVVEEFSQRLSDSRLTWLAEAWVPSLAAYAVAKVVARQDGALRQLITPLARIFSTNRASSTEEPAK